MSLDLSLVEMRPVSVYDTNITHNLVDMAREAGVYECMWRPEKNGYATARQLIPALELGLELMSKDSTRFRKLAPENGWGDFDGLKTAVERLLAACKANPEARVESDV